MIAAVRLYSEHTRFLACEFMLVLFILHCGNRYPHKCQDEEETPRVKTKIVQLFTGFAEDMPAGTASGPGWVPWSDEHAHVLCNRVLHTCLAF